MIQAHFKLMSTLYSKGVGHYVHTQRKLLRLSRLQKTGGLQVGEHLDDVLGHRGRSGQMVSGGLETVLVGGPVDGDDNAIGRGVRVRSLGDGADILGFRSDLLLAAALGDLGAISALETIK